MERANPTFEIQDQSDRIISLLAWVVVGILVLYAGVFCYRQGLKPSAVSGLVRPAGQPEAAIPRAGESPAPTAPVLTNAAAMPESIARPVVAEHEPPPGTSRPHTQASPLAPPIAAGSHLTSEAPPGSAAMAPSGGTPSMAKGGAPRRAGLDRDVAEGGAGEAPRVAMVAPGPKIPEGERLPGATTETRDLASGDGAAREHFAVRLGPFASWDQVYEQAKRVETRHTLQFAEEAAGWCILVGKLPRVEEASAVMARLRPRFKEAQVVAWRDTVHDPPARRTPLPAAGAAGKETPPRSAAADAAAPSARASLGSHALPTLHTVGSVARTRDARPRGSVPVARSVEAARHDVRPPRPAPRRMDPGEGRGETGSVPLPAGSDPSPEASSTEMEDVLSGETSEYTLHVASFVRKDLAITLSRRLKGRGWASRVELVRREGSNPFYRVRVGSYPDDTLAGHDARRLARDAGVVRIEVVEK